MSQINDVTRLIQRVREGDRDAFEDLLPLLQVRLRAIARYHLGGQRTPTYGSDDLLADLNLKLPTMLESRDFENRRHLYAYLATTIQNLAARHYEKRSAKMRGGGQEHVQLSEVAHVVEWKDVDHYHLRSALEELGKCNRRLCEVIWMRYYLGLPVAEVATAFNVTPRTIRRWSELAHIWLRENALVVTRKETG